MPTPERLASSATTQSADDDEFLNFERLLREMREKSDAKKRKVEETLLQRFHDEHARLMTQTQDSFDAAESQLASRFIQQKIRIDAIVAEKRRLEQEVAELVQEMQSAIEDAHGVQAQVRDALVMESPYKMPPSA